MINIIDDVCGAGKTTYIIDEIRKGITNGKKYIFVTPFTDEIDNRILKIFPDDFVQPTYENASKGTKLTSLKDLINGGNNIATTHALFKMIDMEVIDLLKQENYTLIIDEVLDVVNAVNVTKSDINVMVDSNFIHIGDNNKIEWIDEEYMGKFDDYKRWAECGNLYAYLSKENKIQSFVWNFPHQIFDLFEETYILTYMFDCQPMAYYLKAHNIQYVKYSLFNGMLTKHQFNKIDRNLVHILNNRVYNDIGEKRYALSKAWCIAKKEKGCMSTHAEQLTKILGSVCRTGGGFSTEKKRISSNDLIWTTFSTAHKVKNDYENKNPIRIGKEGKTRGKFLSLNARSTNAYKDRHYIFYAANLFFNPMLKKYFYQQNITVNEDDWALSMLIQFICRSAIRENEEIYLYIPSKRMRELLINYLGM